MTTPRSTDRGRERRGRETVTEAERRRERDGRAEFQTILLFDSLDDVQAFAGDEPDVAVFYPEDDRFLVERDLDVAHYEVDAQIP